MNNEPLNEMPVPDFELCEICYTKLQEIMKKIQASKNLDEGSEND